MADSPRSSGGPWSNYQQHVLSKLGEHDAKLNEIQENVHKMELDIRGDITEMKLAIKEESASIKTTIQGLQSKVDLRASLVGILGSAIPVIIMIVFHFVTKP